MEHADGAFAGKPDIATVPVASAGEPDDLSYHARSTRCKSNTAAEILPEGWYHAGVRPAEHVSLPDWVAGRARQGGAPRLFHRFTIRNTSSSTDRSAYFRAWLVVTASFVEPKKTAVRTIMSRNKNRSGQEVEFQCYWARRRSPTPFPQADSVTLTDMVESINNPAHVFHAARRKRRP